jgi:hypothetical protein
MAAKVYLAIDPGAESGRVMAGAWDGENHPPGGKPADSSSPRCRERRMREPHDPATWISRKGALYE